MPDKIIPFLPDIWLFVLIGVLVLIIYYFLPEDLKSTIKKGFQLKYIFYGILIFVFFYYRTKWGFVYEKPERWPANIYYASFMVGFIFLLYFAGKSWLYEMRYYTNHFICNNLSGSCNRIQEIGSVDGKSTWVVFFLGTSGTSDERFVFPWPWAKKLVVVPKASCQFIGNQILSLTQVEKVDILDLNEEVSHFIQTDSFARWCQEEIYLGYWTIQLKASDPKYSELQSIMQKKDARINELKEMLRGKLTIVKGFVSDTIAMQDKLKGKSWRQAPQQPQEE